MIDVYQVKQRQESERRKLGSSKDYIWVILLATLTMNSFEDFREKELTRARTFHGLL